MLYRQKHDTFIRHYGDFGYIVNKANFTDRVVDTSGSVFLSALSRQSQSIGQLCEKIAMSFIDVDMEMIKEDTTDFYAMLEEDGLIVSGETEEELDGKDKRFSYAAIDPSVAKIDFAAPPTNQTNGNTHDVLLERFKIKPHLVTLQIELTTRCNERCVHCYIPNDNKGSDIDPSFYYNVLEQCQEMGVLDLTLSGGEPFLHPQFCDFLRRAKSYDFSVSILSNLTLLNDEIVAVMKAGRLTSIQVSLYSMESEIHDAITQMPGSFEKTKNAILKLIESDIPVQVSCPIMKQNKNCYGDVLKWANDHKCKAMADYLLMGRCDNSVDNLDSRISIGDVETLLHVIMKNDHAYRKEILNTDFTSMETLDISNNIVCNVCVTSLGMGVNGNIYPCSGWQSYVCGNLKESSLRDIWENSPKVNYMRNLRKKDFPMCIKCLDRFFCEMCMVRNANEADGDYFKVNEHFCKVAASCRKIALGWKEKQLSGNN